jgi:hypothetical protein
MTTSTTTTTQTTASRGTHVELRPALQFEHKGKTYNITNISQQVGDGPETHLAFTHFSEENFQQLIREAKKTIDVMGNLARRPTDLQATPHCFTVSFIQKGSSGPFRLFKITYQSTPNAEEKKFEINLESYAPDGQQAIIRDTTQLNLIIQQSFKQDQQATTPPPALQYGPPSQPVGPLNDQPPQ